MFKSKQILSATELIRNFKQIGRHLESAPQALLITQKSGEHLTLVNAEIFEDLLEYKIKADILAAQRRSDQ